MINFYFITFVVLLIGDELVDKATSRIKYLPDQVATSSREG
jgi:hypothetical protein